jgi:hypothetical protein
MKDERGAQVKGQKANIKSQNCGRGERTAGGSQLTALECGSAELPLFLRIAREERKDKVVSTKDKARRARSASQKPKVKSQKSKRGRTKAERDRGIE